MAVAARRFSRPVGSERRPWAHSPVGQPLLHRFCPANRAHPDSGARKAGSCCTPPERSATAGLFCFPGVSGAGKTTISRLAPPDVTLLTDEVSYIRPRPVWISRLRNSLRRRVGAGGRKLLRSRSAAFFFLKQGPENKLSLWRKSEAIRRLMRNVLFFAEDPELVQSVFQSACEFVERVPVQRLTFVPDSRAWSMIRMSEKHGAKYIARSSAIASRMLGGEMMIMSRGRFHFLYAESGCQRDLAGRRWLYSACPKS